MPKIRFSTGSFCAREMNEYSEILDRHGSRNAGDNLTGFREDICAFLEMSDLLEWVELKHASTPDCMITAVCKLKKSVDMKDAQREVERIWMECLRYPSFEKHRVAQTGEGFVMDFVTTTTGLGVVGQIECRR
ncbi:MAG: hypothetical protein JXR37_23815 [Kiritimatiellae bacterium]|nr:hypothetical protein [Kiritimatiellia bacterium]